MKHLPYIFLEFLSVAISTGMALDTSEGIVFRTIGCVSLVIVGISAGLYIGDLLP